MGLLGYAQNGASILGPSEAFTSLPFRGYRERGDNSEYGWREEFVDALAGMFDVAYRRFIVASERANMLDPTFTPSVSATEWLATAHAAPTGAASQATMLDLLAFIALATYPLDQNWSVERRQAMIQVGWNLLRRKGNRVQLGAFTAAATDSGAVYAVTSPPWGFTLAVTDGEPSPGFKLSSLPGGWCYTSTSATVTRRPWLFSALRNVVEKRAFPAWSSLGIGYMQFRAGFSAVGEPVFPLNARLNLLANEHFNLWTGPGAPTSWTVDASVAVIQNSSDANRNHEFAIDPATGTSSCLEYDLTGAAAGSYSSVYQTAIPVDNQISHRFEVDYCYRQAAAPYVAKLWVQILDQTNSLYYNAATEAWQSTAIQNPISPSDTTSTRARYGFTFDLNEASDSLSGTNQIEVKVGATSDGTASSQLSYKVYRVGVFEEWSTTDEQAAGGERTLSLPLVDGIGRTNFGRTAVGAAGIVLEPANASRSEVKAWNMNGTDYALFPHHGALTARGYLCNSTWTNLAIESDDFSASWTTSNCTLTTNATVPPIVGASTNTATTLTQTGATPSISQAVVVGTGAADRYICGLYVKKITADGSTGGAATVDVELIEGATSVLRRQFTLASSSGWQLLALPASDACTGGLTLTMYVRPSTASGTPSYGVYAAYVYDVTGKPGVLYPPIGIGALSTTVRPTNLNHLAYSGANVQHPLTRRQMVTLTAGLLSLTVVPTFDGTSQPNGYIFDVGQGALQNRLSLWVTSGTLQLRLIDNAGNSYAASLTLTEKDDAAAGQTTWRRDTAIDVRARWDVNQGLYLSAGNGDASTSLSAPTTSDASLSPIYIGRNSQAANTHFDGIVTGVEVLQVGPPLP